MSCLVHALMHQMSHFIYKERFVTPGNSYSHRAIHYNAIGQMTSKLVIPVIMCSCFSDQSGSQPQKNIPDFSLEIVNTDAHTHTLNNGDCNTTLMVCSNIGIAQQL